MEKSSFVLNILKIVLLIVFVGLMITTVFLFAVFIISLFKIDTDFVKSVKITLPNFKGKFSDLKGYGTAFFSVLMFLITVFSFLQTYLVSLVIKILQKLNLQHPFSAEIAKMIDQIVKLAVVLAFGSIFVSAFSGFLLGESTVQFELGSGNLNFLIFAAIIYIIGIIYKKGIELQSENELTI